MSPVAKRYFMLAVPLIGALITVWPARARMLNWMGYHSVSPSAPFSTLMFLLLAGGVYWFYWIRPNRDKS